VKCISQDGGHADFAHPTGIFMSSVSKQRDILVTAALPYANGAIHLGHMVEYIQADIWARFQRLRGNRCIFVCGDDAHGTPIMLSAQKQGITPEALIAEMHHTHSQDFHDFLISFDNFYTTNSAENRELATLIYQRLRANNDIFKRTILQMFDPIENIFLPDRFIRGKCPRCGAEDQYGDNCEVCGATYNPTELINPVSALSGATPIQKESEHYFFALEKYSDFLQQWMEAGHLQSQMVNKLKEWFTAGLQAWDISRDAPYFGFEIPDAPNKYFYVWLDAPVGYMASLKNLAQKNKTIDFDHYWQKNSSAELHHFIGKDIVYFHALFWPAMLHGAQFRLPTDIHVHGYLTINGKKMSKSRGTFITARHYLQLLKPEYLRYYFAAKLSPQVEDIDLNLEDFLQRINADLVGKYVNIASRCAGFITNQFQGKLADQLADDKLFQQFIDARDIIAECYDSLHYNKAVRTIMQLADTANQYIDHHKPWILAKQTGQEAQVQAICTQGLNLFKVLTIYLAPILPETANNAAAFLNIDTFTWQDLEKPLLSHTIQPFKPLMQRIPKEIIEQLSQ
jgi:methionyl-tRNA synthetase